MKSSESRPIYISQHHGTTNDLCLFCFPINTVFTLSLWNPSTHFCVKSFRSYASGSAVFSRHTYKSTAIMTRRTSRYKKRRRGARLFVARLHEHRIYSRRPLKATWFLILLNTLNGLSASWLGAYLLANKWAEIYFKTVLGPHLFRQGDFKSRLIWGNVTSSQFKIFFLSPFQKS
jgi:hypothetical protein